MHAQRSSFWSVQPLEEAIQAGAQGTQLAASGCSHARRLWASIWVVEVALLLAAQTRPTRAAAAPSHGMHKHTQLLQDAWRSPIASFMLHDMGSK
jgi:hypothetical protein